MVFPPVRANTPTPWPTPNLDATVAAEVRLRLLIEEQVRATLEAEATPVPTEPPPKTLFLQVQQPQEPILAGQDIHLDFSVTNQLSVPVHEVNIEFVVTGAGRISYIYSEREACRVGVCSFRMLESGEVATGSVSLGTEISLEKALNLDFDATWHLQNSGAMASHASASVELVHDDSPGMLLWSTPVDALQMECGKGIDADAEVVFATFGDKLVALSRTQGELLWTSDAGGQVLDPAAFDGNVLVQVAGEAGGEGPRSVLRSLNASTGTVNWEHQASGPVKRPHLVHEGQVYFVEYVEPPGGSGHYSQLVALEAATGNLVWQYRFDGAASTAAVHSQGYLYLSTSELGPNYLYAFDPAEGQLVRYFESGIQAASVPLVFEGNAYLVSSEGILHSFDLTTGNQRWRLDHADKMTGPPLQANQFVFVTAAVEENQDARFLYGVVMETGMWGWAFGVAGFGETVSVSGDRVYAISPQKLRSMDAAELEESWQATYGYICGPVKVHDGVLYGRTLWGGEHRVFALRGD